MTFHSRKQALLRKYLNNECSHSELKELFDYLRSGEDESYQEIMEDLWERLSAEKILEEEKADLLLRRAVRAGETIKHKPHRFSRWYRVAAALLALTICVGCLYLFFHKKEPASEIVKNTTKPYKYKGDIKPGGTKAILQAGQVKVTLNKKDTSFTLAGNVVNIDSGGVKVAHVNRVQYTLITPRGGEYSLVLADGTEVWLNAGSRLTYPSVFSREKREVRLEGEAYFKVVKDGTRPFIVHTEKQNIRVLGTEFNIQAYPDDNRMITTLVHGKVQVNSFGKEMILKQGQQAVSDNEGMFRMQADADIKQAIAWKEGYFRFDNTNIHDIMKQLSRWYDIKVRYEKGIQQQEFIAIISRDNNISQVLGMLEATGSVHFEIQRRSVTVMP